MEERVREEGDWEKGWRQPSVSARLRTLYFIIRA